MGKSPTPWVSQSIILMSAVLSWGGNTNVQLSVVLQASGTPSSGSTKDLVKKFMTPKVLASTSCYH